MILKNSRYLGYAMVMKNQINKHHKIQRKAYGTACCLRKLYGSLVSMDESTSPQSPAEISEISQSCQTSSSISLNNGREF
jgi:hypothetical protein